MHLESLHSAANSKRSKQQHQLHHINMFGLSYLQALYVERNVLRNAAQQPIYQRIVSRAEDEIVMICYDRTSEMSLVELNIRPCIDAQVARRLVKRAVNRKEISLGLSIRVDLDSKKRVLKCYVPPHYTPKCNY